MPSFETGKPPSIKTFLRWNLFAYFHYTDFLCLWEITKHFPMWPDSVCFQKASLHTQAILEYVHVFIALLHCFNFTLYLGVCFIAMQKNMFCFTLLYRNQSSTSSLLPISFCFLSSLMSPHWPVSVVCVPRLDTMAKQQWLRQSVKVRYVGSKWLFGSIRNLLPYLWDGETQGILWWQTEPDLFIVDTEERTVN